MLVKAESFLCGSLCCLKAMFQLFTSYLKPKPEITSVILKTQLLLHQIMYKTLKYTTIRCNSKS